MTCHECGVDFPAMGGGVCRSCKRTLCASHYGRPAPDDEPGTGDALICDDCRANARGTPRS